MPIFSEIISERKCPDNERPEACEFIKKVTMSQSALNSKLSKRQSECLDWLIKGMPTKKIARVLGLSPRTIEHHLESAKLNLGCFSRAQLIEKYQEYMGGSSGHSSNLSASLAHPVS